MKRSLAICAVALFCAAAWTARAEEQNPYKLAKVGDWVSYKQVMKMPAMKVNQESTTKSECVEKTDEVCMLEVTTKSAGYDMPPTKMPIKLNEKYDPNKQPEGNESKEIGHGEETLTVAGTSYKTKWVEAELTVKGMPGKTTTKYWRCDDVPLGGLVKMTTKSDMMDMDMTLTGTGKGK